MRRRRAARTAQTQGQSEQGRTTEVWTAGEWTGCGRWPRTPKRLHTSRLLLSIRSRRSSQCKVKMCQEPWKTPAGKGSRHLWGREVLRRRHHASFCQGLEWISEAFAPPSYLFSFGFVNRLSTEYGYGLWNANAGIELKNLGIYNANREDAAHRGPKNCFPHQSQSDTQSHLFHRSHISRSQLHQYFFWVMSVNHASTKLSHAPNRIYSTAWYIFNLKCRAESH